MTRETSHVPIASKTSGAAAATMEVAKTATARHSKRLIWTCLNVHCIARSFEDLPVQEQAWCLLLS